MESSIAWTVLTIVSILLVAIFIYALLRMSGDQDRSARHSEKSFAPHSDVTITRL